MEHTALQYMLGLTLGAACLTPVMAEETDRTILPIQAPEPPTITELDVRNVKTPPHFDVKAPTGAPNVVIILIDDLGFGATTAFGGPIATPIKPVRRGAAPACAQEGRV